MRHPRRSHALPLSILLLTLAGTACDTAVTADDAALNGVYVATGGERLALRERDGRLTGDDLTGGGAVEGTHLHPRVEFTITYGTGVVAFVGEASNDGSRVEGTLTVDGQGRPETFVREAE